jgi:hypothetical protein
MLKVVTIKSRTNSISQFLFGSRMLWFGHTSSSMGPLGLNGISRLDPISKAATPRSLNATMIFHTIWSSQPRNSVMRGTHSLRALARMIWLRRTMKVSDERSLALTNRRSFAVNSRTKIGFLMPTNIPLSRTSPSGLH